MQTTNHHQGLQAHFSLIEKLLRNSKGSLDKGNFSNFEKQHQRLLKNLCEFPMPATGGRSLSVMKEHQQSYFKDSGLGNGHETGNMSSIKNGVNLINKDFTSGLKLPQSFINTNDSYDNNSMSSGFIAKKKKRYYSRPKERIEGNSQVLTMKSKKHKNNEFALLNYDVMSGKIINKVTVYSTKIVVDELGTKMKLEIKRDNKKLYITIENKQTRQVQEIALHLKQAQQFLMKFDNDFEAFINESLVFKSGKVILKDLNKANYSSSIVHSSINNEIGEDSNRQDNYVTQMQFNEQNSINNSRDNIIANSYSLYDEDGQYKSQKSSNILVQSQANNPKKIQFPAVQEMNDLSENYPQSLQDIDTGCFIGQSKSQIESQTGTDIETQQRTTLFSFSKEFNKQNDKKEKQNYQNNRENEDGNGEDNNYEKLYELPFDDDEEGY